MVRLTSHKSLIITFLLVLVVMGGLNFIDSPISIPRLKAYTGGEGHLDIQLRYDADEAYTTLTTMGPEGRRAYAGFLLLGDIVMPIAIALFLAFAITQSFRISCKGPWAWTHKLNVVPLLGAVWDLAENALILTMLHLYPARNDTIATMASVLTHMKRLGYLVSLLLLVIGLAGVVRFRLQLRARRQARSA